MSDLLARITRDLDEISEEEHRLRRRRLILREAATQLRTGRDPGVVAALLAAQLGRPDSVCTRAV